MKKLYDPRNSTNFIFTNAFREHYKPFASLEESEQKKIINNTRAVCLALVEFTAEIDSNPISMVNLLALAQEYSAIEDDGFVSCLCGDLAIDSGSIKSTNTALKNQVKEKLHGAWKN